MGKIDEAREVLARVPGWETLARTVELRPLPGGLTNASFTFEVDGEACRLRLSGGNTALLGIDREAEFAALSAAARAGLAPEAVAFVRPEGHLVSRFVPGTVWTAEELRRPETMTSAARALRRAHTLPPVPHAFSPLNDVVRRLEAARAQGIPLPDDADALAAEGRALVREFWCRPGPDRGLCHGDPFPGNFIGLESGEVYLIDWEYAGMGDVFYDLACLASSYPPEARPSLVAAYFDGPPPEGAQEKLAAMRRLSQLWNWTWALIQARSPDGTEEHARAAASLLAAVRAGRRPATE